MGSESAAPSCPPPTSSPTSRGFSRSGWCLTPAAATAATAVTPPKPARMSRQCSVLRSSEWRYGGYATTVPTLAIALPILPPLPLPSLILSHYLPLITTWITTHYLPLITTWITTHYLPLNTTWITTHYLPLITTWITTHYLPLITTWITTHYLPLNTHCVPPTTLRPVH
jgi:hypothetical protein